METVEAVLEQTAPDLIFLHNLSDLKVLKALLDSGLPVVRMVHDHGLYCMRGYRYNYFTRKICARAASPYCVFPCLAFLGRDHSGRRFPLRWVSYTAKRNELRLHQRCRRFVVYSQYMKQELLRNGFESEKIEICLPFADWSDPGRTSSFSPRNLILFAGQIIRGKGVDVLLEALAKVKVPFECAILGDGSHRPACERLCAVLGLQERVRFHGYVLPENSKAFYLEASAFVVSSLWPEPFGLSGPEAMRYGIPVVAFDAGGIREWLRDGKNGFLVPWKDTTLFAARIEELLRDKRRAAELGQGGREWVRGYDSIQPAERLEQVFEQVVRPRLRQAVTSYH